MKFSISPQLHWVKFRGWCAQ